MAGEAAYIVDSPLLLGVRWLRMELSLSVAIFTDYTRREATNDGTSVEERKKLWKEGGEERKMADNRDNEPRSNFPSYGSLCVLKYTPSVGNFGELGFTQVR